VTETPAEISDAILAAFRSPDELQETAERGRRQVLNRYSWDPLADRLAGVWQSVTCLPVRIPV
jgi:glycosyltransferase involved in cell wall biosynthesis